MPSLRSVQAASRAAIKARDFEVWAARAHSVLRVFLRGAVWPAMCGISALLMLSVLSSCTRKPSASNEFSALTAEFVYSSLALSPVSATSAGYHEHKGVRLDEQLDDLSEAGMAKQRQFYEDMQKRLAATAKLGLSPDDQADYAIMQDQIGLNLLELDSIQSYRHNPTLYVELIGNALFNPFVLEYAPRAERIRQITARLEKIPALLAVARKNLTDSPEIWNRVAREENDGNIALIEKTIREQAVGDLKPGYDKAAAKAVEALKSFNDWLASDLSKRPADWRLGKEKYAQKFKYALGADSTPEQLLKDAESYLQATRKQMFDLAKPLYGKASPGAKDAGEMNPVISAVLGRIATEHATPETYFAAARRDLDDTKVFVREKNLMTLPLRNNLQVIDTPEFMRGVYGVGGFNGAPALQPELGAFYWITPIPESWPKERVESKLREYNNFGLQLLTIHEAMPGHYVQFEYANDIQPLSRRLLRGVYGNGAYAEGWAVYVTEVMLDEGYLDKSVELRLTFLKQQLRVIANAILDVRLQTMDMSDEDAMRLMLDQGFQEQEEARAKLQRAKLSSTQLPTYYSGYRDWVKTRKDYAARKGTAFRLIDFHEQALKCGAVPMRVLGSLLSSQ